MNNKLTKLVAIVVVALGLATSAFAVGGVIPDGQGTNHVYGTIDLNGYTILNGSHAGDAAGLTNIPASGVNIKNLVSGDGIASFSYNGTGIATVKMEAVSAAVDQVNTGGVVISTVQLDSFGRVTNMANVNLDGRYFTQSVADGRYVTNGQANSISQNMIVNGAVSSAKIADGAVGTQQLDMVTLDSRWVNVAGDTMTGTLDMGTNKIVALSDPTDGKDAANKQYVDDMVAGLHWHHPVLAYTNDPPTNSLLGDSYLVGPNPTGAWLNYTNNIAHVTNVSPLQYSFEAPLVGDAVFVESSGIGYVFTDTGWVQFNGAANIIAGAGLNKVGNTLFVGASASIDVNSTNISVNTTWLDGHSQPKDADLTAISAMTASGIVVRVSDTSWVTREIGVTASDLSVSNPSGVDGNPTLSLATVSVTGSGQGVDVDSKGRVTNRHALVVADVSDIASNYVKLNGGNTMTGILTNSAGVAITGGSLTLATGSGVNEVSTSVSGSSTDSQLPTAKSVYDAITNEVGSLSSLSSGAGIASFSYNGSAPATVALGTVGTAGKYVKIDSDQYGRVTNGVTTIDIAADTTGNFVESVSQGYGVTVSGSGTHTAAVTVAVDTSALDSRYIGTNATAQTKAGDLTLGGKLVVAVDTQSISSGNNVVVTKNIVKVDGDSAGVVVAGGIAAGTAGQTLVLIGTSDTQKLQIPNTGANVVLNGPSFTMGLQDTLSLVFDGSNWIEVSRADN